MVPITDALLFLQWMKDGSLMDVEKGRNHPNKPLTNVILGPEIAAEISK